MQRVHIVSMHAILLSINVTFKITQTCRVISDGILCDQI